LNVFRESYSLALDVSKVTRRFPQAEQFELARQLRRAARSVPANIVEGWAKRASASEFKRYLQIAIGSCDECKLWLELSRDEGFLNSQECTKLENEFNVAGSMLKSLWRNWKNFQA
jgi:four helix bundle protein